ncbi:putative ABC transporter permease [Limosilactobacillus fastidiosus]|uniref:ABC transporter permease n=1 Tax=Limosilactobacillus fastidiosus TaxID=2759855 RepID=A0A7W3YCC2_9LACO|nr:putative ABC transporter permease [Limosilactobacillus fastidiosus]MBB1063461.1 putative ABC transporter permease [Limosilactobacillus fastidiosus]MBB1085847.1 putative ABC transporter permease [Limosilactobacillus fastidiosus]MCD7084729.1 putative ABC transporter permease [Limosilactobacillus fastidiosus]MCD7085816.1 putative ABC transporter permease [Limosilactobacillus fastidiosus]MCD7113893.1 putative ABC transporter permease [Limosilactobacillus fastidiosus]
MHYSLSEIIVLFFTYSVVGWLWETFYCSIKAHHYAYRGFLFGPYCPVYGFAITTILITAEPVKNNIILLFIVGFIVASIFEYFASLFLEKFFHMKLWDYSKLKGNIQGRVAPEISLFWGIGVVFLVRVVQPFVQRVINWEEAKTHGWLAVIIVLVMGTDMILTMFSIHKLHISTKQWDDRVNQQLENLHQRIHEAGPEEEKRLRQRLVNWRAEIMDSDGLRWFKHQLSWNQRRLIKNFPKMKITDTKYFNEIKKNLIKKF